MATGAAPIHIDVIHHPAIPGAARDCIAVIVDAIGAGYDTIAAMDDGADEVTIEDRGFLEAVALAAACGASYALVAGLVNLRPTAARIASALTGQSRGVVIICVGHPDGPAIEDSYTAGVLIRALLDEQIPAVQLTDAAGMAVSLSSSYPNPFAGITSGQTARELSLADPDGSGAYLRACAQRDLIGIVPVCLIPDTFADDAASRTSVPVTVSQHFDAEPGPRTSIEPAG